ncbi:transcriptional regulator [Flexibacter flexilis DSM 6793]|uniref:Transcriptional regulator n=1 Tax=Flexibacter flexilis DSM 6793 TaxID=927664 RepID=A0A1I1GVK4_9BACT|nr:FMN-binding negative transcriptional regulator [Flexibacter flexilis]SFC13203.1 transcriptional regulator [Flexibacter flexilis DSM 6793]
MYIPKSDRINDTAETVAFMQRFHFATLVTTQNSVPVATHLPFVVQENDGEVTLISHLATANEQVQQLENEQVLVIFSQPHAYISPSLYEKELNVPTWDYVAVHAYGTGQLIREPDQVRQLLETTICCFEAEYFQQWEKLPEKYKSGLMRDMIGLKIRVTELQGKKKLSQNKTRSERENIMRSLSGSPDPNTQLVAEYMRGMQK